MNKKLISCILFLGLYIGSYAQNDLSFSQYMFNQGAFNPASIDISNTINASLLARQQWVGFDNSPKSQVLNANAYIQQIFGGAGINIINDQLGYENALSVRAYYAFPVQVGEKSFLNFGAGAGIISRTIDGSQLYYEDPTDPNAFFGTETFTSPDFSFGLEFKYPGLTAGFSINHLHRSARNSGIDYPPRHYFMYARYRFQKVVEKIDIEPYILVKSNWRNTQLDLNLIGYYDNLAWAGFSVRVGDAVSAMIGYVISPNIRLGYAYDYSIGANRRFSGGSHELMLISSFEGFNKQKSVSNTPRIFN